MSTLVSKKSEKDMGKQGGFFTGIRTLGTSLVICSFILISITLPIPLSAQNTQVDPYYLSMYQKGIAAYQEKNYKESARALELAIFGIPDQKIKALGSVYISLCHYHLNEIEESKKFFIRAEEYVRAQGLETLQLEESMKLEFAELWNHFRPSEAIYRPKSQQDHYTQPTAQELERTMYRLERQIKAVPNDIIAYYDLYQVYLQKRDEKLARRSLERMLKKHPEEIEGYYYIGMLKFQSRDFKSAVKNFEIFLDKASKIPVEDDLLRGAWAYLILSYNFKGDKARAHRLASEVTDALTQEAVGALGLAQRDSVVLRDILEKNKKAN